MADQAMQRVALVTGGAKRVGRAVVEMLAGEGFDVAFTYLESQSEAGVLEQVLRSQGRRALAVRGDLTQPENSVRTSFDAVSETFGRVDVLVNNASLYDGADLAHTSVEMSRKL